MVVGVEYTGTRGNKFHRVLSRLCVLRRQIEFHPRRLYLVACL